ncbi:hypothetical protein ABFU65_10010 [Xanthomonas campestris pv. raphani]|uniref:hypothetical protein n=1 Tax=Xanthomonas campestris TaxID=339 RepID=UPI002B22D193|nr:hypothetical protein [Xanthomonas campestris]MEA9655857.1 hypothetical protein [Xanthomonas campestris pv. raphani]
MRDEKDPGTRELPLPGRPGRPPANGLHAMSDAERAQAYRARKAKLLTKAKPAELSDSLLLDKIRRAIDNGSAKRTVAKLVTELARRYP